MDYLVPDIYIKINIYDPSQIVRIWITECPNHLPVYDYLHNPRWNFA